MQHLEVTDDPTALAEVLAETESCVGLAPVLALASRCGLARLLTERLRIAHGWQFNKLAGPGFVVPRYLFLITVPRDVARYANLSHPGLLLRHIGYFASLQGCAKVVGDRSSVPGSSSQRLTS